MLRYLNEAEKAMMNDFYEDFNKILKSGSYELIAHLYDEMDELKYEVENVFEPMFKERRVMTKQLTRDLRPNMAYPFFAKFTCCIMKRGLQKKGEVI